MASIPHLLQDQFADILSNYNRDVLEPSKDIDKYRADLGERHTHFFPFQTGADLASKNMVAVDGGRTTQKLAGGDLIIVGATLGESPYCRSNYPSKEAIPAEAYGGIVPHTSENQKVEESMMAALELRVLDGASADIKIIDGAYLGNTTTLLYGLTGPALTARTLLNYERERGDGCLARALDTLLLPKRNPEPGETDIVAVVKSDSSFEFARRALGPDTPLSDRIFASRLLKPGEFLNPRPLISSRRIINAYKNIDFARQIKQVGKKNTELFHQLVDGRDQLLRNLDNSKDESLSVLWTTYFKPSHWTDFSPVIRIEFAHHQTMAKDAIQRARELISYLDQDIRSVATLEPMSQYSADRNAKDVSIATDMVKNMLIANAGTMRDALGLVRGYRT
jgi:hypothetical protein